MTKQELFDKVATHLLKQRRVSRLTNSGSCAYRGVEGTSCAIGCLIPDELYEKNMEGSSIRILMMHRPDIQELIGKGNVELASRLQRIHDSVSIYRTDSAAILVSWASQLREVAHNLGLSTAVLDYPGF